MKKYTLVLIVLSSFAFDAIGQELNCTVSLSNTGQVKNRTEEIYNNMRTAIEDFMNSTVWTVESSYGWRSTRRHINQLSGAGNL